MTDMKFDDTSQSTNPTHTCKFLRSLLRHLPHLGITSLVMRVRDRYWHITFLHVTCLARADCS